MIVALMATVGLVAFASFARMVGLAGDAPMFAVSCVAVVTFYAGATAHWYALFQAMPVFAISAVAAAGALRRDPRAFLQKLCLSWLGLLVFGYLLAHAALFLDTAFAGPLGGRGWLATALALAKAADVARLGADRVLPVRLREQGLSWLACPIGGVLAALVVPAVCPGAMGAGGLALLGLLTGAGIGAGARAYGHVLDDVLGESVDRPVKGGMVFAAAFAIALAYHFVRYVSGRS
jgi:predicted CDP-diglyceride synthetase/phosphatidate cytidylyltransferase